MAMSKYLAAQWVNAALRAVNFTAPKTVHLALANTSGEINYGGYARQQLVMSEVDDSGVTSNVTTVRFPTNKDALAIPVDRLYVYDAKTSGNLLFDIPLNETLDVLTNHAVEYEVGSLKLDFRLAGE